MSEETVNQGRELSVALQVLTPKYRKALLRECSEEKIKRICESILNTLDQINIEDVQESKFRFLKLDCLFSLNVD